MIKQCLDSIFSLFGYKLVKFIRENDIDAIEHNDIGNVNTKNKKIEHFKNNLNNDKKTINKLFPVINEMIIKKDFELLDVGCGSGVLVKELINKYPNANILGCDFSEVKIEQCNKYYKTDTFFTHNIYDKIDNKQYDIITCTEVLEHLEHPELALSNLVCALNKNAKLFISVPDGRIDQFPGHVNFWSKESFRIFITKNLNKDFFKTEFKYYYNKNIVIIERLV